MLISDSTFGFLKQTKSPIPAICHKTGPGRIYEQKQDAYFKFVCTAFGILRGQGPSECNTSNNDAPTKLHEKVSGAQPFPRSKCLLQNLHHSLIGVPCPCSCYLMMPSGRKGIGTCRQAQGVLCSPPLLGNSALRSAPKPPQIAAREKWLLGSLSQEVQLTGR